MRSMSFDVKLEETVSKELSETNSNLKKTPPQIKHMQCTDHGRFLRFVFV